MLDCSLIKNEIACSEDIKKFELLELLERHKNPEKVYRIDKVSSQSYSCATIPVSYTHLDVYKRQNTYTTITHNNAKLKYQKPTGNHNSKQPTHNYFTRLKIMNAEDGNTMPPKQM